MSVILTACKSSTIIPNRNFFQWINIIFNKVDEDRRKLLGPDRVCAEWILRNGGAVKWENADEFLADYNKLPKEEIKFHLQEVDATASTIMHYGFGHFIGCHHINKIILHKCAYLEDKALAELQPLQKTLNHLQVTSCHNITETGLRYLTPLTNLKHLILSDFPYLKDKESIVGELRAGLPKCNIQFN